MYHRREDGSGQCFHRRRLGAVTVATAGRRRGGVHQLVHVADGEEGRRLRCRRVAARTRPVGRCRRTECVGRRSHGSLAVHRYSPRNPVKKGTASHGGTTRHAAAAPSASFSTTRATTSGSADSGVSGT